MRRQLRYFSPEAEHQQDQRQNQPAAHRNHLDFRHLGADQLPGDRVHGLEQQHRQHHQADAEQIIGLVTGQTDSCNVNKDAA